MTSDRRHPDFRRATLLNLTYGDLIALTDALRKLNASELNVSSLQVGTLLVGVTREPNRSSDQRDGGYTYTITTLERASTQPATGPVYRGVPDPGEMAR